MESSLDIVRHERTEQGQGLETENGDRLRPRLPLRWRHRVLRVIAPPSWQGRTLQMLLLVVAALAFCGYYFIDLL
jgi:hypothetical protein